MSKFCSNCGTALGEGVAFCHNCGHKIPQIVDPAPQFIPAEEVTPTPQFIPAEQATPAPQFIPAEQAQPQFVPANQAQPQFIPAEQAQPQFVPASQVQPQFIPASQVVPAAPAKKPLNKKALIIGGVAVVAVVALVIILINVLGGGGSSPQTALDNYLAVYNGDASKLESLAPAEYWEYGAEEEGVSKKELLAEMKENLADRTENMKDEYGNYTVTGKILLEEDMDKETLHKITEGLAEYGIKESSVKAGKELSIKLTLKTSEGTEDSPIQEMGAIQIGSSWYLIRYYENGDSYRVVFVIR